jgi:hypothetical protein
MRTAERIDFVRHDRVVNVDRGSGTVTTTLTIEFRVSRAGPAHVAGIVYSTDSWTTINQSYARFQNFDGDSELWNITVQHRETVTTPLPETHFDYVIFCKDSRGGRTMSPPCTTTTRVTRSAFSRDVSNPP